MMSFQFFWILLLVMISHSYETCTPLWIYHRVQKSGSTCIAEALERALQPCGSATYVSFELRRQPDGCLIDTDVQAEAVAQYTSWTALLHGHFYYGVHQHLPLHGRPYLYIISMVEPVQRMISHYNFRKRIGLLEKQLGVQYREDVSWSLFLGNHAVLMCNEMTAALTGASRLHMRCSNYTHSDFELLHKAKRNLETYRLILLREYMDDSWQLLHQILPRFPSRPSCHWDNASKKPKEQPTWYQLQQLKRATLLDRLLYQYAESLFFKQLI